MSRTKVLLAAVVVAVLAGGAGAALANVGQQAPAPEPQAIGPTTSHDLEFVPVEPCRLADTRLGSAAGSIAEGATKSFQVTGTAGFPAHGGTSGGCGIPDAALAAEITLISNSASGSGFFRAYPFGGSPDATFLAFQSGPNLLNTGTVALCDNSEGGCTADLSVRAFQAGAHAILDITGYYVPNRFAFVEEDGTLGDGARVEETARTGEGAYTVTFDSSVAGCALVASPSDGTNQADLWTRVSEADPATVEVDVEAPATANTQQDNEFYVHVVC
jgi:hypothetical protein